MLTDIQHKHLVTTGRVTGIWYLTLAISGMIGFLYLHPQIYITNDPSKTLANLTDHETLARMRLLLEFVIVVTQALAAVWFYKLFHHINHVAAWALAIWGMMNSGVIMISAIAMGSAVEIANSSQAINEKVLIINLLLQLIQHSWSVGGLFFGLWLIPMGYIVVSSQRMPVWLGRILIIGGAGYLFNTFIKYMGVNEPWVGMLVLPATVGEFWMIGYLLIYGIRPKG